MSRIRPSGLVVLLVFIGVTLLAEGPAAAEIVQKGNLRVSVQANLKPKRLPRQGNAPVAVSVGWNVSTSDGTMPPKISSVRIQLNSHGIFDNEGLPLCPISKIKTASSSSALAACRSALIGEGKFSALVSLGGEEPYEPGGKLLVFNGEQHGKPVLLGQIYSPHPFATSFVIIFSIVSAKHGTYGTELQASIPRAVLNWGNLTGVEMTLSRTYHYEGKKRSYISASCPAPKGLGSVLFPFAKTEFDFLGGQKISESLTDSCKAGG